MKKLRALYLDDREAVKARLERSKLIKDGHWLWTGSCNEHNYGVLQIRGINYKVGRLSAYLYLGLNINDSKQYVLHKLECFWTTCFNPDHLYIGNHEQNQKDRSTLVQQTSNYPCNHPRTPENTVVYNYIYNGKIKTIRQCLLCRGTRKYKIEEI